MSLGLDPAVPHAPVMIEERVLQAIPLSRPRALAASVVALCASYFIILIATEIGAHGAWPAAAVVLDGNAWSALILSLLSGLILAAPDLIEERTGQDVAALAPYVPSARADDLRRSWLAQTFDRRALRRAGCLGAALGLVTWALPIGRYLLPEPSSDELAKSVWFLLTVPLLYAAFARGCVATWRGLRALPRDLELDVLDRSGTAICARIGLRYALLWSSGGALLLLMGFAIPLEDLLNTAPALVAIVALTTGALAVPLQRARHALQRAKSRELARLDDELRGAVELLRAGEDTVRQAALVQGFAAWRATVAAASESPLDARTLVRFFLYLVIPVGGWLGGALVERALDALLG